MLFSTLNDKLEISTNATLCSGRSGRHDGLVYEKVIYPKADHAFNNDTGSRYNAEAAQDAWSRTLAWFSKYL